MQISDPIILTTGVSKYKNATFTGYGWVAIKFL